MSASSGPQSRLQAAYDEGLQVRRQLAARLGTPEALRDLSVSLDSVGDVARARSQYDAAQAAYDEGLQIDRQLAAQLGTPQALRDLSVSLNSCARPTPTVDGPT